MDMREDMPGDTVALAPPSSYSPSLLKVTTLTAKSVE